MSVAEETAAIVSLLPNDKAQTVLYFARFLAEESDEQAWEARFAAAQHSPKFQARLADVDREIAEGKSGPLDASQL